MARLGFFLIFASASAVSAAPAPSSDTEFFSKAAAVAAVVAAPVERTIASNNSNAPDIYNRLVAAGGAPSCEQSQVSGDPFGPTRKACRVSGRLAHFTVHINDLLWWYSYPVSPIGDTSCRQQWIAQTTSHGRPGEPELWYFCTFTFVPKS